eukprot:877646-Amphidinium_carterae.1
MRVHLAACVLVGRYLSNLQHRYRLLHSVGHQELWQGRLNHSPKIIVGICQMQEPSHAQAKVVLEDELSPNKAFIFDNQEAAHAFARDLHVRLQQELAGTE